MSEFAELARTLFGNLGDLLSGVFQNFVSTLGANPSYRAGFVQACGLALLVGFISARLLFWYGRVKAFYRQVAVVNLGPKPSEVQRGCTMAGFKIAVVLLIVVCLLLSMLSSLMGAPGG